MKAKITPSVFDNQNLELRKLYEDAASPHECRSGALQVPGAALSNAAVSKAGRSFCDMMARMAAT